MFFVRADAGLLSDPQVKLEGYEESAGMNRHGAGAENALRRRCSESRRPRVMRWRSVRAQRSVDRGRAGGAIEPRNLKSVQGADALS